MTEVLVTACRTGGSGGEDRLTENVTLNFAKVKVEYVEQDRQGRQGGDRRRWAGTSPENVKL